MLVVNQTKNCPNCSHVTFTIAYRMLLQSREEELG